MDPRENIDPFYPIYSISELSGPLHESQPITSGSSNTDLSSFPDFDPFLVVDPTATVPPLVIEGAAEPPPPPPPPPPPQPRTSNGERKRRKRDARAKLKINFRYSSKQRRNVDKHVVRAVIGYYQLLRDGIFRDFAEFGIDMCFFSQVQSEIAQLQEKEHSSSSIGGMKRDYARVVNHMLSSLGYMLIFRRCIEHSINNMWNGIPTRVNQRNRDIYLTTMRQYMDFVAREIRPAQ